MHFLLRFTVVLLPALIVSSRSLPVSFAEEPTVHTVSYRDLPKLVGQKNDHVQAARLETEAAEARKGHLRRSFLPTLEARVGAEKFRADGETFPVQGYGELEAKLNLFRGGRDQLEENSRLARSEGTRADEDSTRFEELHKTRTAYWALSYQQEYVRILKKALEDNDMQFAAAKQRVRAGISSDTDLLEFRMHRVQLEQDLARFQLTEASAERTLAVLIGLPSGSHIQITEPIPTTIPTTADSQSDSAALDSARHWSIRKLKSQEEFSEAERLNASRWWAPSVDLYGGYGRLTYREESERDPNKRIEAVAGVRLTIPFFDGFQGSTEARSRSLEAQSASLRSQQSARELSARMERLKSELQLLRALQDSSVQGRKLSAEYLVKTLQEYRRGVKNSPDALGAAQKHLDSQRKELDLRRDSALAQAELLSLLGE